MKNYSICYLDARGHTQNSELLPFEDNGSAVNFARIGAVRSAIVEVWKEGALVRRLYRDPPAARVPTAGAADNVVRAFARADGKSSLDDRDNEGRAARPRQGSGQ